MVLFTLLMAAAPVAHAALPPCRPAQLRLSADNPDGAFDGMSHSGAELSIRNVGRDCTLPALPLVSMLDRRGRLLAAHRAPTGRRALRPVRLAAGHRAAIDLRWVSGPVFDPSRSVAAETVSVRIGAGAIRARLGAILFGEAGAPVTFDQSPAEIAEGMPAG